MVRSLIRYWSTMRGECVLNSYVHKELFPERFQQVLKTALTPFILSNSQTEDDISLLQRRDHRRQYKHS